MPTDPIADLNEAIQAVRHAANRFPLGKQLAAQKAAAQVLLDHLPVDYRIWPDDEELELTLARLARDLIQVAEQLQMTDDDGDALVLKTLDRLIRELGYVRSSDGIEVPF